MFIILAGGRQCGATTAFLDMIKKDADNGIEVGLVCLNSSPIRKKVDSRVSIFDTVTEISSDIEKLYIEDITKLTNKQLDDISVRFDIVYCDTYYYGTLNETEFNLAKYFRYNNGKLSLEEIETITSLNVNMNNVRELMKNNITRKDIQFLLIDNSREYMKRLSVLPRLPKALFV